MMYLKGISSLALFVLGNDHNDNRSTSTMTTTALCSTTAPTTTLEVCMSPGCVADGANAALLKLQALADPNELDVVPGVCCSLCGNGPVVMNQESNKKYRNVKEDKKLLEILLNTNDDESSPMLDPKRQAVLEGFNLCLEGDEALNTNDFAGAVEKYAMGMDKGLEAALALVEEQQGNTENSSAVPPNGLKWLVAAKCNEAKAKLGANDLSGAIASAESAFYDLSRETSVESLEVLQEACQKKGDDIKELKALEALFNLPEPEKPTAMQTNKRRSLGFRLTRLQATIVK